MRVVELGLQFKKKREGLTVTTINGQGTDSSFGIMHITDPSLG